MKKLLSILLSFVMVFSMSSAAFAMDNESEETDELSISTSSTVNEARSTHDKAIVIVPGIACSTMKNADTNTTVWVSLLNSDQMICTETGTTINNIQSYNDDNYGVLDNYKNLYNSLVDAYGDSFDIIFFDYDWRKNNTTSAQALQSELADYSEVVLVAHSMGGLVAARYLMLSSANRSKTTAFIAIGTPFVGSSKAILTMETGEFLSGIAGLITKSTFQRVCCTIPGAFQLLPTNKYTDITGDYLISVNGSNYNYTNAMTYLKGREWALKSDNTAKPMFSTATAFHNTLFSSGTHITALSTVDTYTIAGTGLNTISRINYTSSGELDDPTYLNSGDETVLYKSAGYGTPDYLYSDIDHVALIKNSRVIDRVKTIISNTTGVSAAQATSILQREDSVDNTVEILGADFAVNDRGWIIGADNSRINISTSADITISRNGNPVISDGNGHLFCYEDDVEIRVGTVWALGENGKNFYALYDGNYEIIVNGQSDEILSIQYMDSGYYQKVVKYNLSNTVGTTVDVGQHDSMEVFAYSVAQDSRSGEYSVLEPFYIASQSEINELNSK